MEKNATSLISGSGRWIRAESGVKAGEARRRVEDGGSSRMCRWRDLLRSLRYLDHRHDDLGNCVHEGPISTQRSSRYDQNSVVSGYVGHTELNHTHMLFRGRPDNERFYGSGVVKFKMVLCQDEINVGVTVR